ncbi:MAG: hypothetical protein ABI813_02125 [Bacteroidota bacterium]
MKQFQFNIQAKGGSGKSMLTYLQALKHQENKRSYFVDLDSSVKTSLQQLKFLQGKTPPRFALMNLLDARDKLDRQLLFENLLELSKKDFDAFYLDFGAPESDQLPSLFSKDYTTAEFKQIETELSSQFIFNIVVAGGGAYEGCTRYLQRLSALLAGQFEVNIYINESTFSNYPLLIEEIKMFAKTNQPKISDVKLFGDFDNTTSPHKNILRNVEQGRGMEAFAFIEKIKILNELSKI